MYWEDFMRSGNCHHVGDQSTSNPNIAMENRIDNINRFQEAMPPKKVHISDDVLQKWDSLLHNFDEMLKSVQTSLLEIKKELNK